MRPWIEGGGAAGKFTDRAEQKIILHRIVRRPRRVCPSSTAIVVALGAQIDIYVCIVFVCKRRHGGRVRAGQMKGVG